MLIQFTAEEQGRIQEIRDSYREERQRSQAAIDAATDPDEHKRLLIQHQAIIDRLEDELQAYSDKLQQERFNQITGGAAGIIAHAREQAPAILEALHKEYAIYYGGEPFTADLINKTGFLSMKQGKLYINANHAAKQLREELQLHIKALRSDKAALQELLAVIVEAAEDSPLTDNAEIKTDEEDSPAPLEVARFRRSPITDITLFGLMNDKANAQIIQESGIFQQKADGQLTLQWAVNQAPQKREQVPVYIALSFDGTEGKLAKKLNAFDNAVYNAIADLFYYWHRDNPQKPLYITPQEIYRRMNGKQSRDGSAKPSQAQVKRISRSIDKMRHVDFYMDISEEIKAHYITLDDERLIGGYIKDYLLNCSEAGFYTEQGRRVKGYRINNEPILYTYNKAKDHVLFLPFDLLDTSAALSDSENVTEFKLYLLQQIFLMKSGTRSSRKIKLSTLYSATGIQPPEERLTKEYANEESRQAVIRRLKKADRDKIEKLLDAWTAKKWIKGYKALNSNNKPVKARQTVSAYEIQL
jgi:hypothetical protein